jgi:hypothetical protein
LQDRTKFTQIGIENMPSGNPVPQDCCAGQIKEMQFAAKNLILKFTQKFKSASIPNRGCQLLYLHTENTSFGMFLKALECKNLGIFFMSIW